MSGQTSLFTEDALHRPVGADAMAALKVRALACVKCGLRQTCNRVVFGEGNIDRPAICFVGEGPGANEDAQGRPFVGRAGELLDKMIVAIGLRRREVYIANVVNCRPPQNRLPTDAEQRACAEWLHGQIRGVQPKVIVALGATAAHALLPDKKGGVMDLRNRWFEWSGIPTRVSYHPAYLLRTPLEKPAAWMDLKAVMVKVAEIDARKG